MQVFISWSGTQSKSVAVALRKWLPMFLDGKITPFVSSEDIDKGDRGLNKIADQLESSAYGIVVVTPSNQNSPWINFEAGALGKSVSSSKLAPLLVGLTDSDVSGPIKQFQNSEATDEAAVLSLIKSLNKALKDPLGDSTVEILFKEHWPHLEKVIKAALNNEGAAPTPKRDEADLLDEVLTTVRSLQRDITRMQRTLARTERQTNQDEMEDEVLDEIMTALGLDELTWRSEGDGVDVILPEDAPKMGLVTQRRLRGLAVRFDRTVKVTRPNGATLSFLPDGSEVRTAAN